MKRFSEKVFLSLTMPTEETPLSDQRRIQLALQAYGYDNVQIPLSVLRQLYPMCRDSNYDITVTLVYRETDWVVTAVEPGDQQHHHYGLAVDYGSTTIVMQLVDLNSGAAVAQKKIVNKQAAYGPDILTRITYSLEDPSHMEDLQRATVETFEQLLSEVTKETGIDAR